MRPVMVTDEQLLEMDADQLLAQARLLFPHLGRAVLAQIPQESLLIDCLVEQWRRDPQLVPAGYVLGHAHGHDPRSDAQIKREHLGQLADMSRLHVASFHIRGLEQAVAEANREAKRVYSQLVEASGDATADLTQQAQEQARQAGLRILEAFQDRRQQELEEIHSMAEQLLASAPPDEGPDGGGVRGVLLELQWEEYQEPEARWHTFRAYTWATYPQLTAGSGRDVVGRLQAGLDGLRADSTFIGPLRLVVLP